MASTPSIQMFLLGTFRIERDTRPIALPTRKVESLLAYLVLFPEAHPREKLAALLWGDSTDKQARHSLRSALTTLRSKLGDDLLLADRETVQLNPDYPLWADVREFEQTAHDESTLSLYQGDLLTDFYDDWVLVERERLRQLYLDTLLRLAQEMRSASQYARAIEFARKVLASEPTNETAHQHLMFCYVAMGDRIGALKQYDECRQLLRDELGVAPSSETVALREQIERELTGAPSREALLTNVPTPLTSFIGRHSEMADIKRLLAATRLLTLTGAGGCGKTRLAIQVATDLAGRDVPLERLYKNGVWWVELAALSDPGLVPQSVATVLGLRESPDTPLVTILTNYCRAKQMLLVLDNCEHLIDACARLVTTLLSACPRLQILATSREVLNISGETTFRVPSLAYPDSKPLPPAKDLMDYAAVQLFTERAAAALPGFCLTRDNALAIVQVCCQLEGIPLAIELAAVRVKLLSVEQIAARLDDRFRLLTGGSRTALPRQQTLRATIDWSHSLLTEAERVLLRRLSVFAGGWTLDAAQAVCSCDPVCADDVLDLLAHLVDKSLVLFDPGHEEARYRMLETIRQYARDKLLESAEAATVRGRHLDYYLKLAQYAEPKLHGPEQFDWLGRLDNEHDNLRAALEWSLADGQADRGLELATALFKYWDLGGSWSEGREWVNHLLAHPQAAAKNLTRANGLLVGGDFNRILGDKGASRQYLEELVVIGRELGEAGRQPLALGLSDLSYIVAGDNPLRAESMLEEGLAIARSLGDPYIIALVLHDQGWFWAGKRDWAAARKSFEEALALLQSIGDKRDAAYIMGRIGGLIFNQHDYATARQYLEPSLRFARESRDSVVISMDLIDLGEIERIEGNYDAAQRDYAEGLKIARDQGRIGSVMAFLGNLGAVSLFKGEINTAKSLFAEELALARQLNSQPYIAISLMGVAGVMAAEKQARRAVQLLAVTRTFFESGNVSVMTPADEQEYERYLALAREQLDEAAFNAAWAEGRAMTLDQAIEYALKA